MDKGLSYIDVGGGVCLECEVITVPGVKSKAAAVVFHPWAWLGGCMWDPVVSTLTKCAADSGAFSMVVRYNVRGVGGSTGFRCLSASADAQDAAGLCRNILGKLRRLHQGTAEPEQPAQEPSSSVQATGGQEHLVLLAYSYGSCVAAHLLQMCPEVSAYVSVGFPLGMLSRLFLGSHSSWQALSDANIGSNQRPSVPCLLLMGTRDQFTSLSTVEQLVQQQWDLHDRLKDAAKTAGKAVPHTLSKAFQLQVLEGCDHFFFDQWERVASVAVSWATNL